MLGGNAMPHLDNRGINLKNAVAKFAADTRFEA